MSGGSEMDDEFFAEFEDILHVDVPAITAAVVTPKKTTPPFEKLRAAKPSWESWSVCTKTTEEEKLETLRGIVSDLAKSGETSGWCARGDAVIYVELLKDGTVAVYDAKVQRKAIFK